MLARRTDCSTCRMCLMSGYNLTRSDLIQRMLPYWSDYKSTTNRRTASCAPRSGCRSTLFSQNCSFTCRLARYVGSNFARRKRQGLVHGHVELLLYIHSLFFGGRGGRLAPAFCRSKSVSNGDA